MTGPKVVKTSSTACKNSSSQGESELEVLEDSRCVGVKARVETISGKVLGHALPPGVVTPRAAVYGKDSSQNWVEKKKETLEKKTRESEVREILVCSRLLCGLSPQ